MRIFVCLIALLAVIACVVCYELGYRSGLRQSPQEEDQRGLVVLALTGYKQAEATNWPKVRNLLATELIGFTHEYERRFGQPTGTNSFVTRFAEAKEIADRIGKQMVPVSASGVPLGSSGAVKKDN